MTKRRLLSLLLTLVLLVSLVPVGGLSAKAASNVVTYAATGGNLYFDKSTGTITDCGTGVTEAVIPETIDGVAVTSIGDDAFSGCYWLESITIPDSVTTIGDYAFSGCYNLRSITIPDSVTSIGDSVFSGCYSLRSITISDSVTTIGNSAFSGCKNLESITIPDSVTTIGNSAFSGCNNLTSITIPDSVTSIGNGVFHYCLSLTSITVAERNPIYHSAGNCIIETDSKTLIAGCQNSTIPIDGSVATIGTRAFSGCSSLWSITIPDGVTSIGDYAFSGCDMLWSITIPDSVTSIGDYAFSGCYNLESITIPYSVTTIGVTSIGDYAFSGCSSLTSVSIDNSVTSIGEHAFEGCYNLESITIPYSVTTIGVTSIGDYAFSGCSSLESIIIPDGVTTIGDYAFSGCSSLESIIIPDGVTTIGYAAFEGCRSLTSVGIPDSVTSIGDMAFEGCDMLWFVGIGNGVTSIGDSVFCGCYNLRSITIPDSVTTIGDYAFEGCYMLDSITIPYSVTTIGYAAFSSCSSLTSISIHSSVTSIGNYAFAGCDMLWGIAFEGDPPELSGDSFNSVTATCYYPANNPTWTEEVRQDYGGMLTWKTYPSWSEELSEPEEPIVVSCLTFEQKTGTITDCDTSVTEVVIPKTINGVAVITIGDFAFEGCSNLTSVGIPDSVTTIGDTAFEGCSSLTSVGIPDSVTTIGDYAFARCSSLTSITVADGNPIYHSAGNCIIETDSKTLIAGCSNSTIPIDGSVTAIGDAAFDGCSNLTSIAIPNSVTSIGFATFRDCSSLMSITIPDSVTTIDDFAFAYCDSLTSVGIGSGVTSIGGHEFHGCHSLRSITVADGNPIYHSAGNCIIETDSKTLIAGCSNSVIPINGSVTAIGDFAFDFAFYGCHSLTSVSIPNSVTTIGDLAFSTCSSLTSVGIGSGVTTIGDSAFSDCDSLTSITFEGDAPEFGRRPFLDVTATCYYPANNPTWTESVRQNYGGTLTWIPSCLTFDQETGTITDCDTSVTEVLIPKTINGVAVTSIGDFAFSGCSKLESITIPDSVTSIGDYAFRGCHSLTSITIPDSVTSIGDFAFSGCSNLTSVGIGSGVTTIDARAFAYCDSLTSITVADGNPIYHSAGNCIIETDSKTLIAGCSNSIIPINSSVTTIGECAFYGRRSLTSITIPNSVTTIASDAFAGCSSLTSITIPNSVTTIDASAFSGCSKLTSIRIPDSVTTIGERAFRDCSSLMSISIPDSVTSIGDFAFAYCDSLTSVGIGSGVTTIGNYAFCDCDNLKSITFEGDAPEFVWDPFNELTATCYYPANNPTWTEEVRQNYGGTLTWVGVGATAVDIEAEVLEDGKIAPSVQESDEQANVAIQTAHITTALEKLPDTPSKVLHIAPDVSTEKTKPVAVTLPKEAAQTITQSKSALNITTQVATVQIPEQTLANITNAVQEEISLVTVSKPVAEYTAPTQADMTKVDMSKAKEIVSVSINDGAVTSFGGESLTLTIPVSDSAFQVGESYLVSEISADGSVENLSGSCVSTENGKAIEVTTTHLSDFVLTEIPIPDTNMTISLSLMDNININLYLTPEVGTEASDYTLAITYKGKTTQKALPAMGTKQSNGSYRMKIAEVYSHDMTEAVRVRVLYRGIELADKSTSVQKYCEFALDDANSALVTQKLKDLCAATLHYGSYAQLHFGVHTDALANRNIASYDISSVVVPERSGSKTGSMEGIVGITQSLVLRSETSHKLYFTLKAGEDIADYTFTNVTNAQKPVSLSATKTGANTYCISISGIYAYELGNDYKVQVAKGNEVLELTFSPMAYAYMARNTTADNLGNLCKALTLYYQTAKDYFK